MTMTNQTISPASVRSTRKRGEVVRGSENTLTTTENQNPTQARIRYLARQVGRGAQHLIVEFEGFDWFLAITRDCIKSFPTVRREVQRTFGVTFDWLTNAEWDAQLKAAASKWKVDLSGRGARR
jgi:leucyl-tRNA synthetase